MEQTLSVTSKKMKGKTPVIILSVFAIVCGIGGYFITLFSSLLSVYFPYVYKVAHLCSGNLGDSLYSVVSIGAFLERLQRYIRSFGEGEELFLQSIIEIFTETVFLFITVLPILMFLVYVIFFFKKPKARVFFPITCGFICLGQVGGIIKSILDLVEANVRSDNGMTTISIRNAGQIIIPYPEGFLCDGYKSIVTINEVWACISSAILCIAAILILVASLKGLTNKKLVIVPIIVGFVLNGISSLARLYTSFAWVNSLIHSIPQNRLFTNYISVFCWIEVILVTAISVVSILASVAFLAAILIFASKNYIPEIIPMSDAKLERLIATKPDKALAILTTRYESGKLTEEEYNSRIAEIENKEPTL